jgi:hypothetical protein
MLGESVKRIKAQIADLMRPELAILIIFETGLNLKTSVVPPFMG